MSLGVRGDPDPHRGRRRRHRQGRPRERRLLPADEVRAEQALRADAGREGAPEGRPASHFKSQSQGICQYFWYRIPYKFPNSLQNLDFLKTLRSSLSVGVIEANLRSQILILQHFSRSTRFTNFCTAPFSKIQLKRFKTVKRFAQMNK